MGWVMRLGWGICFTVAGLVAASPALAVMNDGTPDAWQAANLNLEFTRLFLSNDKCSSANDLYRRSCIAALNAVEKKLGKALTPETKNSGIQIEAKLKNYAQNAKPDFPASMIFGTAINAHLRVFDPHAYLRPIPRDEDLRRETFTGVGLVMVPSSLGFKVVDILPNSPLALSYGDQITAVAPYPGADFVELKGVNVPDAKKLIHGELGTEARLRVRRGEQSFIVTLPRAPFSFDNVSVIALPGQPLTAAIRINSFVRNETCDTLVEKLLELKKANYQNLILDLRGNLGGSLDEAVCATSLFIGRKNVVGTRFVGLSIPEQGLLKTFRKSNRIIWRIGTRDQIANFNMAILIDSGSASASEIMAGTLQFYKRAWVIGERSFGKGSVQSKAILDEIPEASSDFELTLSATTMLYYLPNWQTVQRVGIRPSFEVPFKPGATAAERSAPREAEMFPSSFGAQGESWSDPRPKCIEAINALIFRDHLDLATLAEMDHVHPQGDYQRAFAVAVLRTAEKVSAVDCHSH